MIATGAHANFRTNRSQAIIESDVTKSTAPAPADDVAGRERGREHRRDHRHVDRDRDPQFGRKTGPGDRRQDAPPERHDDCEHDDRRDHERRPRRPVRPETDQIRDVPDEERGEAGDEQVLRQHEQHVARERADERDDEPDPAGVRVGDRVEQRPRPRSTRPASRVCRRTRAADSGASRAGDAFAIQLPIANSPANANATMPTRSSRSRRESLADPTARTVAAVAHAVVQSILAPLPALQLVDRHSEASPERRQRRFVVREPRLDLGDPRLERRRGRRPRSAATPTR